MPENSTLPEITTVAELEALLGTPDQRARTKERARLTDIDRQWLAASPFLMIATSDAEGNLDVSPKGDPAGFVKALDDATIAIPERYGNKRMDGFHNILANPRVGLNFFVPGRGDTLRINGSARLVTDGPFFDDMVVKGHRPKIATVVRIDTVFFHCAKAFIRSQLWQPETWDPRALPSPAQIVKAVQETPETLEQLDEHYRPENYNKKLYA